MTDAETGTYGAVSRANHWIVSLAFLGMLGVGFYLAYGGLEREARAPIMALHKATGTLLLFVVAWRVIWRLRQGFPAPTADMPGWQLTVSKAVHWGLLAAITLMPLSGVTMSLAGGRGISVYGLFEIPAFADNDAISGAASNVHGLVAWTLVGLLVLHIGAALKHQFVDRDGTLARMISGRTAKA
jgi:cytochrome b561